MILEARFNFKKYVGYYKNSHSGENIIQVRFIKKLLTLFKLLKSRSKNS